MNKADNEPGQGEQPEQPGEGEQVETGKYKSAVEEIKAELKSEFGKLPADWSWTRDRKLPATLSREECRELMTAYKKGKLAVRNNLIIRTLYATGLRAEELENLRFCDIFYDNRTVFVRAGKGDKDRYCAIDKGTLEQLKAWQEGKGLEESVFGITLRQIRRVVEGAGDMTGISAKYEAMGRVFSTHSMRHAYATHCYENSMRLPTLQRFLGHEYILTTMVYLYTAQRYDVVEYERTHPLEEMKFLDSQKAKHKCQYCGCESKLVQCDNEGNPISCGNCHRYLRVYKEEDLKKKYERLCPHCGCTSTLVMLDKYGVPIECYNCHRFITLKQIENKSVL